MYNKNISDIKVEENWDNVCTKILPYTTVKDANGEYELTLQNYSGNGYSLYVERNVDRYDIDTELVPGRAGLAALSS